MAFKPVLYALIIIRINEFLYAVSSMRLSTVVLEFAQVEFLQVVGSKGT